MLKFKGTILPVIAGGGGPMMAAVFATMLAALLAGWFGWRRASIALVVLCLLLAVKLFLFEIYSPETGFRMPWIQTEIDLMWKTPA